MAEEGLIFMGIFRKENELKKLDKILNYAVSQVPYYKNKEYQSIEDFPIIKKEIIKADYSNFISDEVENKNKLVEYLKSDFSIEKYVIEKKCFDNYFVEWTTGTSGVPFKCLKSVRERKDISLAMWKRRIHIDNCITPNAFLPIIHTGVSPFPFDIRDYSFENLTKIYGYIEEKGIKCIHISPTLLKRHLSQPYFEKIKLPRSLKYIESTGRYLDDETKEEIEKRYNVKVLNMYGTIETWGIAETCRYDRMHLNNDNVYLELVDEQDNIINECNKVGMVVITALNQFTMPFIRYRTNDYAMFLDDQCQCGEKISLQLCKCRENQYIWVDGKKRSGEDFVRKVLRMVEYDKVFQDISYIMLREITDNEFELLINRIRESDLFEKIFLKHIRKEIKRDVKVNFIYVNELEFSDINPKGYIFTKRH